MKRGLVAVQGAEGAAFPFQLGVNLPWLDYGLDFGGNVWQPGGGLSQPQRLTRLRAAAARIAGSGSRLVRWFLFCDGRAGLRFDARGHPVGLDACVFPDLDAGLAMFREHGLRALFVLFDFLWFRRREEHAGVSLFGRRRVVADGAQRRLLLDEVVRPLLSRYGRDDAIAGWDLVNEPEWATLSLGARDPRAALTRSLMRRFIAELVAAVHDETSQPATVGLASARGLPLVRGLGLDLYQVHWYDPIEARCPLETPVARFDLDAQVILGEFPTRGSARATQEIVEAARRGGYAGALAWSALAGDAASDPAACDALCANWSLPGTGDRT